MNSANNGVPPGMPLGELPSYLQTDSDDPMSQFDIGVLMRRLAVDEAGAEALTQTFMTSLAESDSEGKLRLVEDLLSMLNVAQPSLEQKRNIVTGLTLATVNANNNGPPKRDREHMSHDLFKAKRFNISTLGSSCGCARPGEIVPGLDYHMCSFWGRFECHECGKRWSSAYVWSDQGFDEPQQCRVCSTSCLPVLKQVAAFEDLEDLDGAHDQLRCGMCQKLGRRCDGRSEAPAICRKILKVKNERPRNESTWARGGRQKDGIVRKQQNGNRVYMFSKVNDSEMDRERSEPRENLLAFSCSNCGAEDHSVVTCRERCRRKECALAHHCAKDCLYLEFNDSAKVHSTEFPIEKGAMMDGPTKGFQKCQRHNRTREFKSLIESSPGFWECAPDSMCRGFVEDYTRKKDEEEKRRRRAQEAPPPPPPPQTPHGFDFTNFDVVVTTRRGMTSGGLIGAEGAGFETCHIHGCKRPTKALREVGSGRFECIEGNRCKETQKGYSGKVQCRIHGSMRTPGALVPTVDGRWECKPNDRCRETQFVAQQDSLIHQSNQHMLSVKMEDSHDFVNDQNEEECRLDQRCSVYVAGIPQSIPGSELHALFSRFGTIIRIDNPKTGSVSAKGNIAFVHYSNVQEANAAIQGMNGYTNILWEGDSKLVVRPPQGMAIPKQPVPGELGDRDTQNKRSKVQCQRHGSMRSMFNMVPNSEGGWVCRSDQPCRDTQNRQQHNFPAPEPPPSSHMKCCLHGSQRLVRSLKKRADGQWECREEDPCRDTFGLRHYEGERREDMRAAPIQSPQQTDIDFSAPRAIKQEPVSYSYARPPQTFTSSTSLSNAVTGTDQIVQCWFHGCRRPISAGMAQCDDGRWRCIPGSNSCNGGMTNGSFMDF